MSRNLTEDNPAVELILGLNAQREAEQDPGEPQENPAAPKPKKSKAKEKSEENKEKRDAHINLVLKPSLADALKDEAWNQRRSLNNLVEEVLTNYIKRRR